MPSSPSAGCTVENTFARDLEGLFVPWQPAAVPQPGLVYFNQALADELHLPPAWTQQDSGLLVWAGNQVPVGASPLAQAYAGHQFGGYSPRLGDGRALLLAEVLNSEGQLVDVALKGSGRTPFSRGGDGKAALGPMLREVLISEALHALGIPTTRALAVASTGETVWRDSGAQQGALPGAVLTRVAASHLRVGTFQYAAALDNPALLCRLVAFALQRHYPDLATAANPALALLQAVAGRQAALLAQWMGVGFIHGVMNTDNMTISGETIDYGPCAFMDRYDPGTVFSSIDHHGRYAYGNQPAIARWNLARLAEALLTLLDDAPHRAVDLATRVIDAFPKQYEKHWLSVMRRKLGLPADPASATRDADDLQLAHDFLASMQGQGVDFTLAFGGLTDVATALAAGGKPAALVPFASLQTLWADAAAPLDVLQRWQQRLGGLDQAPGAQPSPDLAAMRLANPAVIARNHQVEAALTAASEDADLAPFNQLLAVLQQPFAHSPDLEPYRHPAPPSQDAGYQTFCGT